MASKMKAPILGLTILLSLSQLYAESKPVLLSTCFSNVCIGDDIDKLIQAQAKWVTSHIRGEDQDKHVVHLRETAEVRTRYAAAASASYHNLSAEELEKLGGNFLDNGYAAGLTSYGPLMQSLARDRVSFIVADSTVLPILKKATVCGLLPVHGVFMSDSGLYTGVLMMPVNGKLTVVQMKRLFNLHVPDDVTEAQKSRIVFDQLAALVKQIDAKYGTQWDTSDSGTIQNTSKAVGDGIVAYLTLDESPRGYQTREIEPMMTLNHPDFDNLAWQKAKWLVDQSLVDTKACAVKTQAVAIE